MIVVYLGLLPALLFSSGEGIRLAPFPQGGESEAESASRDANSGRRYHKNALRIFDLKDGKRAAKKNTPRSPFIATLVPVERLRDLTVFLQPAQVWRSHFLLTPDSSTCSLCGRAPPLVHSNREI